MDAPSLSGAIQSQSVGNQMSAVLNSNIVPRLIGSFNYTDFQTPSATKYKIFTSVLNRSAKARSLCIDNRLVGGSNPSLTTAPTWYMLDTLINSTGTGGGQATAGTPNNGQLQLVTSEQNGYIGCHVDSIQLGMAIGATLPTGGAINIYVVETFE